MTERKVRTVVTLVVTRGDRVLLCKMPAHRGAFAGRWALPGGGFEPGETVEDAARREAREELGIDIAQVEPLTFRSLDVSKRRPAAPAEPLHLISLFVLCPADSGDVILNHEFETYTWTHWDDAASMLDHELTGDVLVLARDRLRSGRHEDPDSPGDEPPDAAISYEPVLRRSVRHATAYLNGLARRSVAATASLDELRGRLGRELREDGTDPVDVIDELVADADGGLIGNAGGRFFGWVVGGAVPAALAADWLASTWDQNACLYATAPAAAVIEEVCGEWLRDLLGLPDTASFALVTGCQMAHVTCFAAARHALLARRGWVVEDRGLFAAPPIRVVASRERHGSIDRAVRLLGLGADQINAVPVGPRGDLEAASLERFLDASDEATVVVLQAGDINTGVYDAFDTLIRLAHAHGAWVHVDGAFGLWANASSAYRHLLRGVHAADSWATDGHKWLNVPYDCGYAFVADASSHRAAMSHRASYLTHDTDARDEFDWNPEWSRRARGVATYAAIRQLGRRGIADLVDRCCRHARVLVEGLGRLPGGELLAAPVVNQGLVRFRDPNPNAVGGDHDRQTERMIAAIRDTGEAFFSGTTWRGMRCMRVSVCNWRTNNSDVARVLGAAASANRELVTPGGG